MKLSKRSLRPLLLDLFHRYIVNTRLYVLIQNLFIGDEKEAFDGEIDNMPLVANTMVDRFVLESKFAF